MGPSENSRLCSGLGAASSGEADGPPPTEEKEEEASIEP